jgi:hypothetical protein
MPTPLNFGIEFGTSLLVFGLVAKSTEAIAMGEKFT